LIQDSLILDQLWSTLVYATHGMQFRFKAVICYIYLSIPHLKFKWSNLRRKNGSLTLSHTSQQCGREG